MNVVEPYFKIWNDDAEDGEGFSVNNGLRMLKKIEHMARISHRSEEAVSKDSWARFLDAVVMGKGDWSVVEHASMTVVFYVDRGITHEIVRHRLASYTQESTRFVNYVKKMLPNFIYPRKDDWDIDEDWRITIQHCEEGYQRLIAKGWTPQEARSVFPNALGSKIAMTCNLRNWRHYLLMRSTREAHPQMRQVIDPLLSVVQNCIPLLYDDIVPGVPQAENLKKMR